MHILVAYDISNDKTRKHIEKYLRQFGCRVNYSVFECVDARNEIIAGLKGLMDSGDDIRTYQLCKNCFKKRKIIGKQNKVHNKLKTKNFYF